MWRASGRVERETCVLMSLSADVVIIGSGIGGGTLAYALRNSGFRVLVIERGPHLPREPANWDTSAVFRQQRYRTPELWEDRKGKLFRPEMHYFVGGNSKFFGAVMCRFREADFDGVSHYRGSSAAWPFHYSDIEPYYAMAESIYGVRGTLEQDPTEPPHSMGYPFPNIGHEPALAWVVRVLQVQGLHPFEPPIAVHFGHGGRCIRCATCDGFPCRVDAKGDSEISCIRPALLSPQISLMTETMASRVLTDSRGERVVGVETRRDGAVEVVKTGTVVVACGAVNSAALLLRSASKKHPHGLANSSRLVGRNYMQHTITVVMAIDPVHRNLTKFQKTVAINDYYGGDKKYPFPMGNIQAIGKVYRDMMTVGVARYSPGALLAALASHSTDWLAMTEDLPDDSNRVEITPSGRIRVSYLPTNTESHRALLRRTRQMLRRAGFPLIFSTRLGVASNPHQCGTARFGHDPLTSVLDPLCRAHDVKGLLVVDASCFPSSAAVNPALTIAAQALRVGEHVFGVSRSAVRT